MSGIDNAPVRAAQGYEHLSASSIAVLRWLNSASIDFVLVGAVAREIRGARAVRGPVAIVPAPYGRNLDRLAHALASAQARLRAGVGSGGIALTPVQGEVVKLDAQQLLGPQRFELRCGSHDLDVEGRPEGVPSYQELLFESVRFELSDNVAAEVAAPEDIELYDHLGRTGTAPEIRVSRVGPSRA